MHGQRAYVVCAMARTGSNLLVDGLAATGAAGRPNQFFLEKYERKFAEKHGVPVKPFEAYLRGLVRNASSANAVFGFKLMSWYLETFLSRLRGTGAFGGETATELEVVRAAFPRLRFVQIVRGNKLQQAISKARALQTGVWKVKGEKLADTPMEYDAELIRACLSDIDRDEQTWSRFFTRNGVQPFVVQYEQLCAAYGDTIREVLHFLKIRLPKNATIGSPITVRQSDEISSDWERRFLSLTSDPRAALTL